MWGPGFDQYELEVDTGQVVEADDVRGGDHVALIGSDARRHVDAVGVADQPELI